MAPRYGRYCVHFQSAGTYGMQFYLGLKFYKLLSQKKSLEGEFTQYPFFVRFFYVFASVFLFLKKCALFRPNFYKSISALNWLLHVIKNLCINNENDISK